MDAFVPFPKVPRLSRECVITEKIDGTNASIHIKQVHDCDDLDALPPEAFVFDTDSGTLAMVAASRKRYIGVGSLPGEKNPDNQGFAAWVYENRDDLLGLGEGSHFGEWWGQGIQRGYGLKEKRFSLFNTGRWTGQYSTPNLTRLDGKHERERAPNCCDIVPVLTTGLFREIIWEEALNSLKISGSFAASFDNPEGIMIFHVAAQSFFKKTIKNDAAPKSQVVQ